MRGFKSRPSAQHFLGTRAAVYNTFGIERHLKSRGTSRILRLHAGPVWSRAAAWLGGPRRKRSKNSCSQPGSFVKAAGRAFAAMRCSVPSAWPRRGRTLARQTLSRGRNPERNRRSEQGVEFSRRVFALHLTLRVRLVCPLAAAKSASITFWSRTCPQPAASAAQRFPLYASLS